MEIKNWYSKKIPSQIKKYLWIAQVSLMMAFAQPHIQAQSIWCDEKIEERTHDLFEPKDFYYPLDIVPDSNTMLLVHFASHRVPDAVTLQVLIAEDGQRIDVWSTWFISSDGKSQWNEEGTLQHANKWPTLFCGGLGEWEIFPLSVWSIPHSFSTNPRWIALLLKRLSSDVIRYRLKITWSAWIDPTNPESTVFAANVHCFHPDNALIRWKSVLCQDEKAYWKLAIDNDFPFPLLVDQEMYQVTRYDPEGNFVDQWVAINFVPEVSWIYTVIAEPLCNELMRIEKTIDVKVSKKLELSVDLEVQKCEYDEEYDIWITISWDHAPFTLSVFKNSWREIYENLTSQPFVISVSWNELPRYFSVVARNEIGCRDTRNTRITNCCPIDQDSLAYRPNIFSPNYDWCNDTFTLYPKDWILVQELQIFDRRWNQIRTFDRRNEWEHGWSRDGTLRGLHLTPWVYLYIGKGACPNGEMRLLRGDITLIR